jgi:hypothetical protein
MLEAIDEVAGKRTQTDILERVYVLRRPNHVPLRIRVRVHRNFYADQSLAIAEVLTAALEWTEIAISPPSTWHQQGTAMSEVVDKLIERAEKILTA